MDTENTTLTDGDAMENSTLDANTGGRVRFELDTEVRILQLDGSVSGEIYQVDQERSDRKGLISLRERDGSRKIKIHHRRILQRSTDGKAVVVESRDKFWALCPDCGQPSNVEAGGDSMVCSKCSKTFQLHWLGVKPMTAEAHTEKKAPKPEKAPKAEKATPKAEKAPREPKQVKEPVKLDLAAIAKTKNCELFTKKQVKFDHERIDVQAHVLLFVGDNPRKLCFNTYNLALGQKSSELPLDAFVANKATDGTKPTWFPVADLEKARAKLTKGGYERQ